MVKKKLTLLLATVMTTSVLSTGFSKEIVTYAETTTPEVKQTYTDRVYLSELGYEGTAWSGSIVMDKHSSGSNLKLKVNGAVETFNKGVYAHAESDLIYDVEDEINKGFNTFIAYMGVDASQNGRGNVIFKVSVSSDKQDWQILKTTEALTSGSNAIKIQEELPAGTKYLRLQADPNGHNGNDHAVYGDAILVGDDYLNVKMPEGMKSVEELDKEIMALDKDSIGGVATTNGHKLYQREFVKRVGYDTLIRIFRDEKQYEESLSYLFENEKALSYFIETGLADVGDSYLTVLKNFDLIYKQYKDEIINDDFILKLAVATSWAFAQGVYFWANHYDAQDVVERFEIYKDFATVTDQPWSWSQEEIQYFKNQTPAMLKYTINSRQNNDEIKWFADYIKNVKNGSMNGYHYVEYKTVNSFTQPQYYGEENFDTWDAKYNLSKYDINTDDSNKVRWYVVMEVDGVCGAIAKTYTALQETVGRPSGVVHQPGHAASIVCDSNGNWSIVNDVYGWPNSKDEMKQMPLTWGMQAWNTDTSASYIVLTQNVLDNYDKYQMATKLNILADIYKDNKENREIVLNKALEVQSNNLDSMYNLIQAYKADSTKTSDDYMELAREVVENFKYYPLPMVDLLNQIQPKIESSKLPLFDLIKTNGLKDGTVATSDKVKQPDITKTMANHLLNGSDNSRTFTFSFTGDKANKLIVADKYSDSQFATRYSIDGGDTWTDTTDFPEIDLNDVADQINADDDILIKILGANDVYTIDITKADKPNGNTLRINDLENTLIGKTENLQYRIGDDGEWKDFVEGTRFEGNVRVYTRYKSHGTYVASDVDFYTFKEDSDSDERKYVTLDNFEIVDVASSNETKGQAVNLIDGNDNTSFVSTNQGNGEKFITLKLDEAKYINSVVYTPFTQKGRITELEVQVSMDGENFKSVKTQEFKDSFDVKTIDFEPTKALYVKLIAKKTSAPNAADYNLYFSGKGVHFFEDTTMKEIMASYVEPTIQYSTEETTDGEVIATVNVTEGTTMEGESSHTFLEDGSYTFKYTRPDGSIGELVASVDWIETEEEKMAKIMASYVEPTIQYSTEETTDGEVIATVNVTEGTVIEGESSHIFSENGSYTFKYTRPDGSTGELVVDVNWIEKVDSENNISGNESNDEDNLSDNDENEETIIINDQTNQGETILEEENLSGDNEENTQVSKETEEVNENNQEVKDTIVELNEEDQDIIDEAKEVEETKKVEDTIIELNEENLDIIGEAKEVEEIKKVEDASAELKKNNIEISEGTEEVKENNQEKKDTVVELNEENIDIIGEAKEVEETKKVEDASAELNKDNIEINKETQDVEEEIVEIKAENLNNLSTGDKGAVAYLLLAISSMLGLRKSIKKNKK